MKQFYFTKEFGYMVLLCSESRFKKQDLSWLFQTNGHSQRLMYTCINRKLYWFVKISWLSHFKAKNIWKIFYFKRLGQLISSTTEKYVDPKKPWIQAEYLDLNVRDAYGNICPQNTRVESSTIYTDYDNVKVVYSCTTVNNFWIAKPYTFYYVAVRDKNFDSINKFLPALNYLRTAGVSCDTLQFLPLSGNCPN